MEVVNPTPLSPRKVDYYYCVRSKPIPTERVSLFSLIQAHCVQINEYQQHDDVQEEPLPRIHEHLSLESNSLQYIVQNQLRSQEFIETFFDTKSSDLLQNNYWLRFRNNEWSLKYEVQILTYFMFSSLGFK